MSNLGFYCFTSPIPTVELTLKEKIALLTNTQKLSILTGYTDRIIPEQLDHKTGISKDIIVGVYQGISDLQDKAKELMCGGSPPAIQADLISILQPLFADIFTASQVTSIVNAMVKWCKYDGTGTFIFYKDNIIL